MRRELALILFLSLLFCGCGQRGDVERELQPEMARQETQEVQEDRGEDATARRILGDWSSYLAVEEALYGDLLWSLSYLEALESERSWEDLQLARMAFYTAERYAAKRELPEMETVDADYDPLIRAGKDLAFVLPSIEAFARDQESVLIDCARLRYGLDREVFWAHTLDTTLEEAALHRERYTAQLRYLAAETEALLLALDDGELTERFNAFLEEECPRIAALRTGGDADALLRTADGCVDELEELTAREAQLLGRHQAVFDLLAEAVEREDLSVLQENAVRFVGLPTLLPYPDWYDSETVAVYWSWTEADGSQRYPAPGEVLARTADGCLMTCPEVTREELRAYGEVVARYGIPCEMQEEGELLALSVADGAAVFLWAEEQVHISMEDGPLCFAPGWYIMSDPGPA